jgi:hypothetical protein
MAVPFGEPAPRRSDPLAPAAATPLTSPSPIATPLEAPARQLTPAAPNFAPSFGAPLTPPSRTTIPEPPPALPGAGPAQPRFAATGNVSAAFSTPSTPAPPPAVVPGGQRRPINPFLANDPNQKARRLARALVSDMVAYHPSKREEGLQGGTLKQLFRDEIKKSYEEYVEQVGREFAESTAHFQEALNDVLAGGRKIF